MSRLPNWGKLHYHRHFLPLLLLLFVERISVKIDDRLSIGAGLTAFNFLFGQSLNACVKWRHIHDAVCLYIVVIIGTV